MGLRIGIIGAGRGPGDLAALQHLLNHLRSVAGIDRLAASGNLNGNANRLLQRALTHGLEVSRKPSKGDDLVIVMRPSPSVVAKFGPNVVTPQRPRSRWDWWSWRFPAHLKHLAPPEPLHDAHIQEFIHRVPADQAEARRRQTAASAMAELRAAAAGHR